MEVGGEAFRGARWLAVGNMVRSQGRARVCRGVQRAEGVFEVEESMGWTHAMQSAFCCADNRASKSHCPLDILRRCEIISSKPSTIVEPS